MYDDFAAFLAASYSEALKNIRMSVGMMVVWHLPIHIISFLRSMSYNQSEHKRLIGGIIIAQNLTYTQCGDYYIPDIRLAYTGTQTLGKYGRMRRAFLEQSKPMLFNDMVLTETLFPHLREVQQTCEKRMELLMAELLARNPVPDKVTQQLAWSAFPILSVYGGLTFLEV